MAIDAHQPGRLAGTAERLSALLGCFQMRETVPVSSKFAFKYAKNRARITHEVINVWLEIVAGNRSQRTQQHQGD
jgi:hypothetical protein